MNYLNKRKNDHSPPPLGGAFHFIIEQEAQITLEKNLIWGYARLPSTFGCWLADSDNTGQKKRKEGADNDTVQDDDKNSNWL